MLSVIALPEAEASAVREICALKDQHWPHSVASQLAWWSENSHPDDLLVRLLDDGALSAFLRLRKRMVISDEQPVDALCVTEVCVAPRKQGTGAGRNLMQAAKDIVGRASAGVGYLLCRTPQQGFYAKSGWVQWRDGFAVQSTRGALRLPEKDELCFVADPVGLLTGKLTLIGDVF